MIMPKSGFGYGRSPIEFENLYKKSINFWITDKGELLQCEDHETEARDYIRQNDLLLECTDWMKATRYEHRDYRSFVLFKKGWIRLTTGISPEGGFGVSIAKSGIADKAFDAFTKCLNTSFTTYCSVDICYEDNSPETSTTYGTKEFSKMLREIKMKVWLND